MSRRPEIGNVQLYPNRPLKKSDRNGYVLKFYCPILGTRVRKNCGTRDQREARRIQRDCRARLLNGEYVASGGAITSAHVITTAIPARQTPDSINGRAWQDCYDKYREHRKTRIRSKSLIDALSRVQIAERIFEGYRTDRGLPEGIPVAEVMTLEMLEYLQDRLLAGDECRYDRRSPNTVNSMMGAVMAFVRFCHGRDWIGKVPPVEKLDVDDVMKGRPISAEEFERMLAATPDIVGSESASSWQFGMRVLWESGFRIGDMMDFSWDNDDRHIHPVWPSAQGVHPTLIVPSTQKNGKCQEIPLLPDLGHLLRSVNQKERVGWVVKLLPIQYEIQSKTDWFRPTDEDLRRLATQFSNRSIAAACGVSDTAVRKWLATGGIVRHTEFNRHTGTISENEVCKIREHASMHVSHSAQRSVDRLTKEHVSRVIGMIGEKANVIVRLADSKSGHRIKFASAHDLRRSCAQRLINAGVSAETLKVIFRHSSFATTEKYYGATRSAQSAATEVQEKLTAASPFVGGLVGGQQALPQLSESELRKLKALLEAL